jgi:iron(III) transport system ATP-binding protein
MSLSDRVVVMKDGFIRQIGPPSVIYEEPNCRFVAGFVGKATFFPVTILRKEAKNWICKLGDKEAIVSQAGDNVIIGEEAVLMARPESLRVVEPGSGHIEGKVRMNVYLGNSLEAFISTSFGEVLVQVDDPHAKKIYAEGSSVSIDFAPDRVRLLSKDES